MTALQVKYDDLDWEDYCVPYGALYNGKKFTGTAIHEFGDNFCERNFVNGLLNGRYYILDKKNNKTIQEEFYENGISVKTHFTWIKENKRTKIYNQGKLLSIKIEDKDQTLLFEYDKEKMSFIEWFKNGNKISEKYLISSDNLYQFNSEKFWNENGIWLMTITNQDHYEFNNAFLLEHSFELDSKNEEKIFLLFSQQLLNKQYKNGIKYLQLNTTHKNPFFRYQAARLLSKTDDLKSIIFLEKLLSDHIQPQTELSLEWDNTGSSTKTEHPISKMAQIAIENIKTNKL